MQRLTLAKALDLINQPVAEGAPHKAIFLACGFTPLHLATFLKAHGRARFPGSSVEIESGLFDDLAGSLERGAAQAGAECVALIEWADLDARLGLRHAGGWPAPSLFPDIEREVASRLERISAALGQTAVVAVAGPTLPLPPVGITGCAQDTAFELRLRSLVDEFLAEVATRPGIRVVSQQELALVSPLPGRLDLRLTLAAGFPYTLPHADALAGLLIETLYPGEPKKGLITDADDTLWLGILGEVGVENIAWSLEKHAQPQGLYQQFLGALAERGVLTAIASKNDAALVQSALARNDLLVPASAIFPVEANWGPKSASVGRILQAWNIGPKDVVFVDDSPMELAEVSAAYPDVTCLRFPAKDPQALWDLFQQMRRLFGRQQIQEEDRIRVASLRSDAGPLPTGDDFLERLQGKVVIDFSKDPANTRSFELVNKTNQFNLNGRRWTQGEWLAMLNDPQQFVATVSYEDKFGPLGKIAVATGRVKDGALSIDTWVLSCRAFSRRIEHHTLTRLIAHCSAERVVLDYHPNARNGPVRDFLEQILESPPSGNSPVEFTAVLYAAHCPALPHAVVVNEVGIGEAVAS